MKASERYTGITRTLPYYGADDSKHNDDSRRKAYKRLMRTVKKVETGKAECFYVAFAQKPAREVLYCYLIIDGKVRLRANISHWIQGDEIGTVTCFDDTERKAKWWAVLTAPISRPREEVKRRGHQGIRYVEEPLW